jgi:transcriptional regulator with GAF, ATPase, and Fis domain
VVECDRLGLALVKENGQTLQTFSARVTDDERRHRPRSELEFPVGRTIIGSVVTSREPLLATDLGKLATDFLDASALHDAGFRSVLFVPLVAKNRALGVLSLASRSSGTFAVAHIEVVAPITEILAVGILAQQLQVALGKYRTMETMAKLSLVTSSEINSAVQIIVGQCSLLEREQPGLAGHRDLAQVVQQARRISLLVEKMHGATQERLREATFTTRDAGVPSSPEGLADESTDS